MRRITLANNTFLNNIDESKVNDLLNSTKDNCSYFNSITDSVTKSYTEHLDKIMQKFYKDHRNIKEYSTEELESLYLELTNLLYFMGDRLEQLGINNDLSKAARQEIYNKAYLDNQIKDTDKKNKTTVSENQAVAEEASKYESVVNSIYERAYRIVKYKIDAGYEMVHSISKVLSKRIKEVDLTLYSSNRIKTFGDNLNEQE